MTAGRVLKGIEFAHPEGSAPLLLDLYLPAAPERSGALPAVIHYHGGGWRVGARSSLGAAVDALGLSPIERLVDAGLVVASAEFGGHLPCPTAGREGCRPVAPGPCRWLQRGSGQDLRVGRFRVRPPGQPAGADRRTPAVARPG
jgi:hypothetical protein